MTTMLPTSRKEEIRARQLWRRAAAARLASEHGGVVDRRQLAALGITRFEVRGEIAAGRWASAGIHTLVIGGSVVVGSGRPTGTGLSWQAVWESAPGALLDGASGLVASGLTGFTPTVIDVSVPRDAVVHPLAGVRVRRRRVLVATAHGGVPRTPVETATIRAAQMAVSDRQAALLICLPIQQRLTSPARLLVAWRQVRRSPNRRFLDAVVRDVCDGVHSLGELDFAGECRRRRIQEPVRQSVRRGPHGRVYLTPSSVVAWSSRSTGSSTARGWPRSTMRCAPTRCRWSGTRSCGFRCWDCGSVQTPSWTRWRRQSPG
ncbi:MAG: hypothetical protein V9G19_13480 [Tetrasphaera sp.]